MVTKIFAKAHGEPLDLLDETAKITQDGNAFSGGPANYDKQMVHAWAGLNMQGEEGDSSIAGVNMMRRAMFNDKAAGNDKSKKEKGLSMEQLLMIQQAQAWMNDRLGEIGGQLDALANIEQKIFEGTFDPVNNAEDLKLLQAVDPDITAEKWTAMDDEEKRDWVIETRQALEQERADIEELKAAMQKIDLEKPEFPLHEPFSVTNNVFSNPILEEAAKKSRAEIRKRNRPS